MAWDSPSIIYGLRTKFMFYIELKSGERLEWRNLSHRSALGMQLNTKSNYFGNAEIKKSGWKEMKSL